MHHNVTTVYLHAICSTDPVIGAHFPDRPLQASKTRVSCGALLFMYLISSYCMQISDLKILIAQHLWPGAVCTCVALSLFGAALDMGCQLQMRLFLVLVNISRRLPGLEGVDKCLLAR
jgi:hypothetical protein